MARVSFANLDLSFMKPLPAKRRPRRKPERDLRSPLGAPMVMSDIREFVANATDTPQRITSRSQLARYERSNNIRQAGDYKPGEVVRRERKRIQSGIDRANAAGRGTKVTTRWA